MIHKIPKPELSPNFTVEDIRKVRTYNYEVLKDATPEERRNYYRERAAKVQRELELGELYHFFQESEIFA